MKDKKFAGLTIDNLNSKISLSDWLCKNLKFYKSKKPSNEEMKIFLNYLKRKVFESNLINKKEFVAKIKKIKNRIERESKKQ